MKSTLGLLERAEKSCLITNSLKGPSRLKAKVEREQSPALVGSQ
jgi:hypothetical protein